MLPTKVSTAVIKSHRARRNGEALSNQRELSSFFLSLSLSLVSLERSYFFSSPPYIFVDFLLFSSVPYNDVLWQGVSRERPTVHTSQVTISYVRFPSLPFAGGPVSFLFATPFSFLPCSTSSSCLFSSSSSCSCSAPSSWVPLPSLRPLLLLLLLLLLFRNGDAGFPLRVQPEPSERTKRPIPFHDDGLLVALWMLSE